MKLVEARSNAGFDGYTPDGKKTVQVKAKGPSTKQIAFSYSETQADHLLVLELDFDGGVGRAIYNGPERYVREFLPTEPWKGQKSVSVSKLRKAATRIVDGERLPMFRASLADPVEEASDGEAIQSMTNIGALRAADWIIDANFPAWFDFLFCSMAWGIL